MELNQDFREFIQLLNDHDVKYLVVGGYAVSFHGYPRFTGDIDFWIAISNDNSVKIAQVLREFGFAQLKLEPKDFMEKDTIIQLGHEPNRIDILTSISGLSFNDCIEKSIEANFDGLKIKFIDLNNLRINKASTGRAKDIGDLENLPKHE